MTLRVGRSWVSSVTSLSTGLVLAAALTAGVVTRAVAASQPLAEVNGEVITSEEIEKALRLPLSKLEEQIHQLKRQRLETVIRDRLLAQEAKRRGLSVPALLDAEVTSRITLVTEQEIERFFQTNRSQFTGDEVDAREQIRGRLQARKVSAKREEFIASLRSKANVVTHLEAPPIARLDVSVDGAPARGAATAPVTIVEFSDFLCPFCKRVQATLDEIARRYGDKVRFVFRNFPIEQLHPGAQRAAEAARCAGEQGKFWPYHDVLFGKPARPGHEDLVAYAGEVGLDAQSFSSCLRSGKYAEAVQKDVNAGKQLGINGTPAFFVNGRAVVGAQPVETFVQVIEDELSRRKSR